MAAENNPANEPPFDPLNSPTWMFDNDDDILLAPPLEEFFSDVAAAKSPGPIAPPPKIDDIITGGYTGWVPIIRAGESLAEAEARAEQAKNLNTESDFVENSQVEVLNGSESVSAKPEVASYVSTPIVDDPDLVSSPSQALDQARKRIAAMRASLQLNLNQVAESFAHPIFTPPAISEPATAQSTVAPQPTTPTAQPPVSTVTSPSSSATQTSAATSRASNENVAPQNLADETAAQMPHVTPQPTRIFTPTETQTQPETEVQAAPADHSLELMIMRDEIKDLRDRLDSSQKLIEELMHRLANLAELALRR
jgi:hypothetical protein